jgi:hypothetical protein
MWLIGLEAGVGCFLFVFIVWWTMFAGKPKQPPRQPEAKEQDKSEK